MGDHFGIMKGTDGIPGMSPDGATMVYQLVFAATTTSGVVLRCVVVMRVFNHELKDLRSAWRVLFCIMIVEFFFDIFFEPFVVWPHVCENVYVSDAKDCGVGGKETACVAVPMVNPAVPDRCRWESATAECLPFYTSSDCELVPFYNEVPWALGIMYPWVAQCASCLLSFRPRPDC